MQLAAIAKEPAGSVYRALLDFALGNGSLFSLTWRDRTAYGPEAEAIGIALNPDLVAESRTDRWPGTRLLQPEAVVRIYRMSSHSRDLLANAERLFAWDAPSRPEDLAFYTPGRDPWLGSIAHDADSFLYPDAVRVHEVVAQVGLSIDQ